MKSSAYRTASLSIVAQGSITTERKAIKLISKLIRMNYTLHICCFIGASFFESCNACMQCTPSLNTWKIGRNWWNTVAIVRTICRSYKMSAHFWNEKLASSYGLWPATCHPEIFCRVWRSVCSIVPNTFAIRQIHFIRPSRIVAMSCSAICRCWPIPVLLSFRKRLAWPRSAPPTMTLINWLRYGILIYCIWVDIVPDGTCIDGKWLTHPYYPVVLFHGGVRSVSPERWHIQSVWRWTVVIGCWASACNLNTRENKTLWSRCNGWRGMHHYIVSECLLLHGLIWRGQRTYAVSFFLGIFETIGVLKYLFLLDVYSYSN